MSRRGVGELRGSGTRYVSRSSPLGSDHLTPLRIPAKVISRSEAPSGCLFLSSTARYGPLFSGRPTWLGRAAAAVKLGVSGALATLLRFPPLSRARAAKRTGRYRAESVGRPELAMVSPASLCRVVLSGKSAPGLARSRRQSASVLRVACYLRTDRSAPAGPEQRDVEIAANIRFRT